MSKPVNNEGISAKINVGGLKINLNIGGSARVSNSQSRNIFNQVNQNLGKNPNHTRPDRHAGDAAQTHQHDPLIENQNHGESSPPARNQRSNKNRNDNAHHNKNAQDSGRGNGNNRSNRGHNAHNHASQQSLTHGRGHHKTGHNQTDTTNNIPPNNGNNIPPKGNRNLNNNNIQNHTHGPHNGRNNTHNQSNPPPFQTGRNTGNNQSNLGVNLSVDLNLKAHGNQPNGLIRAVVNQVLQQNDIYLSHNAVNKLINNQTFQTSGQSTNLTQVPLPQEINHLVRAIGERILSLLDNSRHLHGKMIHEVSREVSRELQQQIQTAKSLFLKTPDVDARHFKHLDIRERMLAAVELMPRHFPASEIKHLHNHTSEQVLSGLLLTRGLVAAGERSAEVRNLIAFQPSVLPAEVSLTALRDVGQLVKILIADAAAAKNTASLDLAVQKFVRILIANNELGVLMAAVHLARETQNAGGVMSRALALAQIYQLINHLLLAGERAMKEAMPDAASKNIALKPERNGFLPVNGSALSETDETNLQNYKFHATGAESSLRQFLEFNPALAYDNSASAFNSSDDARQAQKDFISLYHDDIQQWLESGNHRFVKDIDFEKPVGIVVERATDGFFTASKARVVLVRDGTVQGWHFLKSFLVK
jgi:hypothetical protein